MRAGSRTRVAIDFGTCNSAAAVQVGDGPVEVVRLGDGETMSSAVFADGRQIVVGKAALNNAVLDPAAFERTPKRRIGEPNIYLGSRSVPMVDVVAAVLGHILRVAQQRVAAAGGFDEVIITHPESWGEDRLGVLRSAAAAVGVPMTRLRLVSEPVAAAWFYASRDRWARDRRMCVVDFGGGTCDVAVIDPIDGGFRVAAVAGDDALGGDDFDARLHNWTLRALSDRGSETRPMADVSAQLTLAERIRDAKETLSQSNRAVIGLPTGGAPLQINRAEFEGIVADLVGRSVTLARRALGTAGPSPRPPVVYLSGGSSHIPLVHTQLAGVAEVQQLGDPKTVVVQGALLVPADEPIRPPVPVSDDDPDPVVPESDADLSEDDDAPTPPTGASSAPLALRALAAIRGRTPEQVLVVNRSVGRWLLTWLLMLIPLYLLYFAMSAVLWEDLENEPSVWSWGVAVRWTAVLIGVFIDIYLAVMIMRSGVTFRRAGIAFWLAIVASVAFGVSAYVAYFHDDPQTVSVAGSLAFTLCVVAVATARHYPLWPTLAGALVFFGLMLLYTNVIVDKAVREWREILPFNALTEAALSLILGAALPLSLGIGMMWALNRLMEGIIHH